MTMARSCGQHLAHYNHRLHSIFPNDTQVIALLQVRIRL
uniref:Uncharacterized protein n=1 Tax=Arundo donax TaxID=35708 RepID=A0A0A9GNE3_ARUDO